MKDGHYDLCLSTDGYDGRGSLVIEGKHIEGGNDQFEFEGHLSDARQNITAVLNVLMDALVVPNSRLPRQFSLQMTGTATDDDFSLIGTGPLGLIIEIDCSYRSPLDEERRLN
jgi:hypothetical protein